MANSIQNYNINGRNVQFAMDNVPSIPRTTYEIFDNLGHRAPVRGRAIEDITNIFHKKSTGFYKEHAVAMVVCLIVYAVIAIFCPPAAVLMFGVVAAAAIAALLYDLSKIYNSSTAPELRDMQALVSEFDTFYRAHGNELQNQIEAQITNVVNSPSDYANYQKLQELCRARDHVRTARHFYETTLA